MTGPQRELREFIKSYVDISSDELSVLMSCAECFRLNKRDMLLKDGQIERHVWEFSSCGKNELVFQKNDLTGIFFRTYQFSF